MTAEFDFREWRAGEPTAVGPFEISVTLVDHPVEAYALRVRHDGGGERDDGGNGRGGARRGTVALGGTDAAGQFYAVQTFRQLIRGSGHKDGHKGTQQAQHAANVGWQDARNRPAANARRKARR